MSDTSCVLVERLEPVAYLTINRPELRNAFDAEVIARLTQTAIELQADEHIRVVVLRGAGAHFCAGADLRWMRDSIELNEHENLADAQTMGRMFAALQALPQIVVAQIQGAAVGGGAGLVAIADYAVAAADAVFGFTEVRLGLIPAVISPYVLAKIGPSHARARFVTGARFDAPTAAAMGFIHEIAPSSALSDAVDRIVTASLTCAPQAIGAVKQLLERISPFTNDADIFAYTTEAIARRRCSAEAQAGLRAFLDHTPPPWTLS